MITMMGKRGKQERVHVRVIQTEHHHVGERVFHALHRLPHGQGELRRRIAVLLHQAREGLRAVDVGVHNQHSCVSRHVHVFPDQRSCCSIRMQPT
ncbi:MAG: hypothetical protein E6K64_02295 [Nitrospirae bacterium]|nr:MAG: hypothetical protein E6K64_02295 [Nitrospirota bacterium]